MHQQKDSIIKNFSQQQIDHYTNELTKCGVLVQHDGDVFELHRWFRERDVNAAAAAVVPLSLAPVSVPNAKSNPISNETEQNENGTKVKKNTTSIVKLYSIFYSVFRFHLFLWQLSISDFNKQNNPGGGACMFYAFGDSYLAVFGVKLHDFVIRRMVCNYMKQHADLFDELLRGEYADMQVKDSMDTFKKWPSGQYGAATPS